ncbi:hypothetical protein ACE1SV_00860 [Streptomyces sp. E-15]
MPHEEPSGAARSREGGRDRPHARAGPEEPPGRTGRGRYHLLLSADGRPVQHGWWGREEVARDKFRRWVGEYGGLPGARVTLTDEQTADVLATWPDQR